jgi:hypothetical protein
MMIEFDRNHGLDNIVHRRGFKPVVAAPSPGTHERNQRRFLFERPDQGRLDPIGMERGIER